MRLLGARLQQKYVFKFLEKKKFQHSNYNPSQTIKRCNSRIEVFSDLPTVKKNYLPYIFFQEAPGVTLQGSNP